MNLENFIISYLKHFTHTGKNSAGRRADNLDFDNISNTLATGQYSLTGPYYLF